MEKNYDVLLKNRLYFGGAKDAEVAFKEEAIDIVIDVRVNGLSESEQSAVDFTYKHLPIAEEDEEVANSIQVTAREIARAYEDGKKVYFHCGGGGGRAGVAAVATLLELGIVDSLENAEQVVKEARPQVTIRPNMKNALQKIYK